MPSGMARPSAGKSDENIGGDLRRDILNMLAPVPVDRLRYIVGKAVKEAKRMDQMRPVFLEQARDGSKFAKSRMRSGLSGLEGARTNQLSFIALGIIRFGVGGFVFEGPIKHRNACRTHPV
jgi:hypothetical protein